MSRARLPTFRMPRFRLPSGLYGRAFLIILAPVVIMQSLVTYTFFDRHWEYVTKYLARGFAGDIGAIIALYEGADGALSLDQIAEIADAKMRMKVSFMSGETLPTAEPRSLFPHPDLRLRRELNYSIDRPFWFDTQNETDYVEVRIQYGNGVLRVRGLRQSVYATTGHIFLYWMIGLTLLLMGVALLFLRNQVRPLQRLAHAAEEFGRGRDVPDFRPAGAAEVRSAARAFIGMRARINRYIHQRTDMLTGVSHDLRTPLTRMKLALAMMPPTQDTESLQSDIREMEGMLEEYLAFARGEPIEEMETHDVAALIEQITEEVVRGGGALETNIHMGDQDALIAPMRRHAVKRAVHNLVANALSYAGRAELTVRPAPRADQGGAANAPLRAIEILVDDDGPGIPEEQYADAFKPFNRLDESRNQNESGVGLGLALARDTARSHGGDISLARSPLGGLQARLRLPT
ncbi:MAG: ATP-binding protein [Pseudomonadota bacterium]